MATDEYGMTYWDIMEDLANDRDDTYDPEFRDPDGYCEHGQYVGGCGADLMCGDCEMGISAAERIEIDNQARINRRKKAARARLALRMAAAEAGYTLNDLLPIETIKRGITG